MMKQQVIAQQACARTGTVGASTPVAGASGWLNLAALAALAALGVAALLAPDAALAQSYGVAAVPYSWIATIGHTAISSWDATVGCPNTSGDDSLSQPLPIGFTFKFGATNYTQLRIFSNGRVQFNNTRCSYGTQAVGPPRSYPDPMPASNLANTIRVYGADLDPSGAGGGTVSYATVGSAPYRVFVVSWNGVPQWSTSGNTSYNLQIQLYESGEFWFMYGNSADNYPSTTTIGAAQLGWDLANNDYYVQTGLPANNSGLRFTPATAAVLTVTRISNVVSDPVNGTSQPKRVPGSVLGYTTTVSNAGKGTVDSGTLVIADLVPANTSLYVAASPIVTFTDGTTASGLVLAPANVSYSRQAGGGAPFTYTPVADASGYDAAVTGIQVAPSGTMKAASGGTQPAFSVSFKVKVR